MTQFNKLSITLTAANFVLLSSILVGRVPPLDAKTQEVPVLRGRAIEIVDAKGVVRFSVDIAAPSVEGGKQYPDRVLMRIGSPGAGPGVKVVSSAEGTALLIMHNDWPAARLVAQADSAFLRLVGADGKERTVTP